MNYHKPMNIPFGLFALLTISLREASSFQETDQDWKYDLMREINWVLRTPFKKASRFPGPSI